jgi:hypothetical protein
VTVAVETRQAERAAVILERSERPGERSAGVACKLDSVAEVLVLSRGAWVRAEAETVAGSPVEAAVARRCSPRPSSSATCTCRPDTWAPAEPPNV